MQYYNNFISYFPQVDFNRSHISCRGKTYSYFRLWQSKLKSLQQISVLKVSCQTRNLRIIVMKNILLNISGCHETTDKKQSLLKSFRKPSIEIIIRKAHVHALCLNATPNISSFYATLLNFEFSAKQNLKPAVKQPFATRLGTCI